MKKIYFVQIIVLLYIFFLVSCESRMDVTNILKVVNGKTYCLDAPYKNTDITIMFSGNSFSGFAGVNSYFGNIETKNNQIVINNIGRTRMAGPKNLMDTEEKYLKSLNASTKINVINKELRIGDLKFVEK